MGRVGGWWYPQKLHLGRLETAWNNHNHYRGCDRIESKYQGTQGVCCDWSRKVLCPVDTRTCIPRLCQKGPSRFHSHRMQRTRIPSQVLQVVGHVGARQCPISWSMAVVQHFDTDEKKNEADAIKKAITLYLESLVGLKYIGNQVIHRLDEPKRPDMAMPHLLEYGCCPHFDTDEKKMKQMPLRRPWSCILRALWVSNTLATRSSIGSMNQRGRQWCRNTILNVVVASSCFTRCETIFCIARWSSNTIRTRWTTVSRATKSTSSSTRIGTLFSNEC